MKSFHSTSEIPMRSWRLAFRLSGFVMFRECHVFDRIKHVESRFNLHRLFSSVVSLEMRQKFDAGEDPLDPENQQGGGGREQSWPFHFDPFQSGGSFHFKFHHN